MPPGACANGTGADPPAPPKHRLARLPPLATPQAKPEEADAAAPDPTSHGLARLAATPPESGRRLPEVLSPTTQRRGHGRTQGCQNRSIGLDGLRHDGCRLDAPPTSKSTKPTSVAPRPTPRSQTSGTAQRAAGPRAGRCCQPRSKTRVNPTTPVQPRPTSTPTEQQAARGPIADTNDDSAAAQTTTTPTTPPHKGRRSAKG